MNDSDKKMFSLMLTNFKCGYCTPNGCTDEVHHLINAHVYLANEVRRFKQNKPFKPLEVYK